MVLSRNDQVGWMHPHIELRDFKYDVFRVHATVAMNEEVRGCELATVACALPRVSVTN